MDSSSQELSWFSFFELPALCQVDTVSFFADIDEGTEAASTLARSINTYSNLVALLTVIPTSF